MARSKKKTPPIKAEMRPDAARQWHDGSVATRRNQLSRVKFSYRYAGRLGRLEIRCDAGEVDPNSPVRGLRIDHGYREWSFGEAGDTN